MRWRLSVMMFLQFAGPGAVLPLFTIRLHQLHFTPMEMGWACAGQAVAGIMALVAGQVADRWFAAERSLAVCAACTAVLFWVLGELTSPLDVSLAYLGLWIVLGPTFTLGTAISFAHLPRPDQSYGQVRLWGTIGWIVPLWLLGFWFSDPARLRELVSQSDDFWPAVLLALLHSLAWLRELLPPSELVDAFRLAGILALLLTIYALTLPRTPPTKTSAARLAPLAALRLLKGRPFAVFVFCLLGMYLTMPFGGQVTPLFLEHLGIPPELLSPTMTISQISEVVCLALLPLILARIGFRGAMLVGLGAWTLTLGIQALGEPTYVVVSSLALNGLCVAGFLVAGQLYVNSRVSTDTRASAQALFSFTGGTGLLLGHLLVGWVRTLVHERFDLTFAVAAALGLVIFLTLLIGFPRVEEPAQAPAEPGETPQPEPEPAAQC